MTPAATIRAALGNANVRAMWLLIRRGESSITDDAYTVLWGGKHFPAPPWVHPYHGRTTTEVGHSTAAGAGQFLGTTWARLAEMYPEDCRDFSPPCQDFGAVALIAGRGALEDVIAGRIEAAIAKLRPEWTSLPGASESRGDWTLERAMAFWDDHGGTVAAPAPGETPPPVLRTNPTPRMKEQPMPILALLSAFGPVLGQLIPQVAKVLNPQGEVAKRNIELAGVVLDSVTKAADAANVQEAVEKMQASPELVQTVTQAIVTDPKLMGLIEVGGGIEGARKADYAATQAEHGFWMSPAFWITVALMPLLYMTVWRVLWADPPFSDEMRVMVVTAIATGLLGSITGFFLGSAMGSQKKDETIAQLTKGQQ